LHELELGAFLGGGTRADEGTKLCRPSMLMRALLGWTLA
jgi:hypothetical protein